LAVVDGSLIHSVHRRGKECGDAHRWAHPKSAWKAVDAWGQLTGTGELVHSEVYDVTNCREAELKIATGKPGVGLYVSEDSAYHPGPSAMHVPSFSEKRHFEHFLGLVDSAWLNGRPSGKTVPSAKRSMFFQFTPPKQAVLPNAVDAAGKAVEVPRHWAVAGGPTLVVAYLGANGHWKVATVKRALGVADSYTPKAIFDMNGDGVPEIVYQSSDGSNFADNVLQFNPQGFAWEDVAESPGGAAL
jgi:hypothetical protein